MRRATALLGLFTVLLGILVEILIRYWISIGRPPISTGPITLASIGFTCLVPLGLVILVYSARN